MMRHRQRTDRRGAAYLVALLAGTIVTVTGLAALSMATTRARMAELGDQFAAAQLNAHTALEHAMATMATHMRGGGTRSDIPAAAEPTISFNGGSATWRFREINGSPVNNIDGPLVIEATGMAGSASYGLDALLVPTGVPVDSLDAAMYVGGNLTLNSLSVLTADYDVVTDGNVTASSATVNAPVESRGTISGSTYSLSTTEGAANRQPPDPSAILKYGDFGTTFRFNDLPTVLGTRTMSGVLLSPTSNPFGSTNPLGVYVIDCNGQNVSIHNLRVYGTLVLKDAGASSIIGGSVHIEPVHPWLPALVVEGNISFLSTNGGPNEATLSQNLNPPGAPYNFEHDTDTLDVYPGLIKGITYATGNMTFALGHQNFEGVVVAGGDVRLFSNTRVVITHDPSVAQFPPFAFFEDAGEMAIDPATITWTLP